ncbi:MAG: archaeal flagellar protein FlaI [Parcubacteria bacterium C7867-004]|nr:MAG: archaeal flagellar protein FlaI [Parcubacteria bacterium C7867-004]
MQQFDTEAEDAKLASLRASEEEDLVRVLSEKYGIAYTDLGIIPVNVDALRLIPEKEAREAEVIAFDKSGKHLSLAMRSPGNVLLEQVEHALEAQGFILSRFLASRHSLERGYERYKELSFATESHAGVFDIAGGELETLRAELINLPALRARIDSALVAKQRAQVSKVLEFVLAAAFAMRASDIHLEPEEHDVRLRLRLDGQLTDAYSFDPHTYQLMSSRIKLLSGLKLNVHNRAQDGRFTVPVSGAEVEIRTSLIPGAYGESFVMRILDPSMLGVTFESLGIQPKLLARLETEITRPTGMLLTTGPTGSGKTTSLYAFLKRIHTPEVKIVTIEDPVEYHLPGIVQTQADGEHYTFASGLRSVLRQDPDVIMVGEIRDSEVADTAVQAALTGHFVFSTLHTNNAAGTFPRLVDLGVDPKTFASAVSVAMAQRLVRKLDPEARKQVPATDEQKKTMEKILSTVEDKSLLPASLDTVWVPDPKDEVTTGYRGRVGLYEAIFMDEELGTFLRDNPSEGEIAKSVRRQGFLTMAQDGVLKAIDGTTSLDEVLKVVDIPRD